MGESDADKLSRVRMMASGSETWDLSRNDVAALKHVLTALAAATEDLTAARALLRECLEGREDCDDLTCSTTNRCEFCDLSARIEAHIGRDK